MSSAFEATDAPQLVTLAEAAEQLDVHYMTAYRYVRTGRMLAEKRGGKWWVAPDDLAAVIAEGTGARRRSPQSAEGPREFMVEPFTVRLIAGDTAGCWDLINDALSGGATPAEVHTRLLQTALVRVGEGWQQGKLSVSDEHRATATAYRLLGQLGPLFRHRGRRRGTVVLGSISGDPHAMPTAMLADLLSDRRFEVIDLGANTPTASFVEVVAGCDDLVGVGVCSVLTELASTAARQVEEMRQAMPDVFLLAGGTALVALRSTIDPHVDVVTTTSDEACDAFESALEQRSVS